MLICDTLINYYLLNFNRVMFVLCLLHTDVCLLMFLHGYGGKIKQSDVFKKRLMQYLF